MLIREGIARLVIDLDSLSSLKSATPTLSFGRPEIPSTCGDRGHPDATDQHRRGLRAAEAIRAEQGTAVGILILSQHVEPSFAMRLVSDGAVGVG